MTQRALDIGLAEIKQSLIEMAGYVEIAIEAATKAWKSRTVDQIEEVYQIEDKVNACHLAIDDSCFKFLATQHPLATDLRFILSVLKINNDLERIVDQSVNIVNTTKFYLKSPQFYPIETLSLMADEAKWMVRSAIDAFIKNDEALAKEICLRDDKVDDFKDNIFEDLLKKMKTDVGHLEQGINLILIARNIERIGDHATNIAEDVIFTISGKDIRHGQGEEVKEG